MKNGKAISVDGIANEIIKNDASIRMLTRLYNIFYSENIIPELWKRSLICPIYKGGQKDRLNPLSYRPISLISNPCKLFSSIMNERLMKYLDNNSVLVEEQNGFRKNRSCLDHIFVLSSVLRARICNKKHTYCCFVDFSKAFDFLNRDLMLFCLKEIGINGKFLSMVKVMYSETKAAIRINDKITDWFRTEAGIRQGQNDSPTIFAIFINSLAKQLKNLNKGVIFGDISITTLLYADDIILLAETENNLQDLLKELSKWCKRWRMCVNVEKTQILHFRPKRYKRTTANFKLGGHSITISENYRYLGCTINEYLDNKVTGNAQAEGASRALGKLLSKFYSNKGLGFNTYKKLYESCIVPIMDYAGGVWGYEPNENLKRIQIRAMRCFLGVNRYAPIVGVEGEMGWTTPAVRRKLEILRLWNRLMSLEDDRLPRQVFNNMSYTDHPWVSNIKKYFTYWMPVTYFTIMYPLETLKHLLPLLTKS